MHADDGLEVSSGPCEFEDDGAPEAVTDGSDLRRVDSWLSEKDLQPRSAECSNPIWVFRQQGQPGEHLVTIQDQLASAVIVEGEGHVTHLGKLAGSVALMVIKPRSFVCDQDPRSLA